MVLTDRQHQILTLLHSGQTYRQVAKTLGVSSGSVSNNVRKMALRNGYGSARGIIAATRYAYLKPQKKKIPGIKMTKYGNYEVEIAIGGNRRKYLGRHPTYEKAIAARLEAEEMYRGAHSQSGD